MVNRLFLYVCVIVSICVSAAWSQPKKNLLPEDYGKWQTLATTALSPNGTWVAYAIDVQEDNDTMYVQNRLTGKTYKLEFATNAEFSKDNQWVAYRIGVAYKEEEKLREQMKPVEYKMGLLHLLTGKIETVKNVSRYGFSRNGKYLAAYLAPPSQNRDKGAVLLVKNLSDSTTHTIGNVTEYAFNKKSDYLAYLVESANTAGNSAELLNLNTYSLKVLASDTAKFSKLTWQKEGDALAFYKSYRKDRYEEDNAMVYAYTNLYKAPVLQVFNPEKTKNFPAGMRVFSGSDLAISNDRSTVLFGLRKWTYNELAKKEDKKPGDSLTQKDSVRIDSTRAIAAAKKGTVAEKLAGVDVWHWKDPEVQPRQKVTLGQDTVFSYLSAWNLDNNSFFQLATEEAPNASMNGNSKYAVVFTDKKYKPAFKEDYADAWLVNIKTGQQKLAFEKSLTGFNNFPQSSPDGKYLLYFKDKNWWSYNLANGQNINLTAGIKSTFWDVRDDHPASKPAIGSGGWLKGDKEVLLYDEYDVWAVNPDGKGAHKLSDGAKEETVYRVVRMDNEEPFLDDAQPLYFSAYGDTSKQYGYAKLDKGRFSKLVFEKDLVNRMAKAKDAEVFTYVKQDFNQSPTLYVTDHFATPKEIIATNPQQQNYYWGKSELISYTNQTGKKMQGALFYPANYIAGKQYPMIVYIYELLSNTVHGYTNPSQRSPYNTTNFTTNGYFVFRPDIVYQIDDPGISAVNCVVPAVEAVIKTGMIDTGKIGLMGHSWGAYQTSFIITQTRLFKAACAGAPLTNLISMSNSIYWNNGTPDARIFETSQGRFSGPWYEQMDAHMRNSPMYQAANIQTPLLIAFGDKDGAVDWHQGIEMYSTMRRMQKPFVMLVYADENHSLAKKENQIDYQKRQREWFDYYLLGKPAPKWITDGIPMQDKMRDRAKEAAATPSRMFE